MKNFQNSMTIGALLVFCLLWLPSVSQNSQPYSISDNFIASGYMPETLEDQPQLILNFNDVERPDSSCIQVTYRTGPKKWGGLFWQSTASCWCDCPRHGKNLDGKGYTRISFYARGYKGNEVVKFLAGMDCEPWVRDFQIIRLTKKWAPYSFDLSGINLSNIKSPFGFAIEAIAQPAGANSTIFYLDDIKFE